MCAAAAFHCPHSFRSFRSGTPAAGSSSSSSSSEHSGDAAVTTAAAAAAAASASPAAGSRHAPLAALGGGASAATAGAGAGDDGSKHQQQQAAAAAAAAAASQPVGEEQLLEAVRGILSRVGVNVAARFDDQRALVEETLRLRAEAEAARADAAAMRGQVNSMAAANQRLQGGFVCQICQDEEIDRILVPCGHMICQGCLGRLRSRSCPFCRQNFATTCPFHKSYLANDD